MTQDVDSLVEQELYWNLLKVTEESLLKKKKKSLRSVYFPNSFIELII